MKALLQIDSRFAPGTPVVVAIEVPRAYVKLRFPWMRVTLGKTRLSWGQGLPFNAGDLIFGSMSCLG